MAQPPQSPTSREDGQIFVRSSRRRSLGLLRARLLGPAIAADVGYLTVVDSVGGSGLVGEDQR